MRQEDDTAGKGDSNFAIAMNVSVATGTPDAKVSLRVKQMTEDEKAELHRYEKQAQARVGDATEWLVEKPTVKAMAEAIRNTAFGKVRGQGGEDGRYVVISYQPKIAAEPTSMPHLRIPPLRNSPTLPGGQHYKKMIQAVIQSRQPADSDECGLALHDGDCFVVGDAGRHGNTPALLSVFSTDEGAHLQKVTKTLYCHYSEEDPLLYFTSPE